MFARILFKSFRGRDSRQVVAFFAVVIAAAVASTLFTIRADAGAKINVELRAYGANLVLVPAEAENQRTLSVREVMAYPWPASSDTLHGLAPVLYGVVHLIADSAVSTPPAVVALGADFGAIRRVNSFWEIKPALNELRENEVLAGQAAARKLGLSIGQSIRLRAPSANASGNFRLAGIVSTGENEDDQIILSLQALQQLLDSPDRATLVMASLKGGPAVVEKIVADISQRLAGVKAKPVRKIAESEAHVLQILTLLMTIVTVFTVIVATLCLGATMTALIVERQQEVGVMKALGAESRHVARLVAAELILLGLSGGVAGYGVGLFFAEVISKNVFNTYAAIRLEILPAVLILALGISLVAAVFPLRRALQIEPTIALRGE
ncbi:MAG: FtsX-like permease family protein [candidate division KSB1 bacterium]|nr:FtsX-like permease family protein [candidate division KSB1 bacterium]MDZ7367424.1 FtsX-like permease family protein [candidate division KSB1 bacterium]